MASLFRSSSSSLDFPSQYINFKDDEDLSNDEQCSKQLTFIGASAVSLLCYEKEGEIANLLRNDSKYQLVKRNGIVSDIWSLAAVTGELNLDEKSTVEDDAAPLIAWSVRLQALFVGFRGSQSARDILSNIDVRQTATTDLASRFHSGFLLRASPYSAMIRQLARKYNVIVCGHSLGGAMATIAAYHAMAQDYAIDSVANVWQMNASTNTNHQEAETATDILGKISTVTFGAPPMMVLEPAGTTATLPRCFTQNFHHIINRNDIVPFIVNSGIRTANNILTSAGNIIRTTWPNADWLFKVLGRVLEIWADNNCPFGHYGRLYLLDRVEADDQRMRCQPVITLGQLPRTPPTDFDSTIRFHSIAHYNHCLGRTLAHRNEILDSNPVTAMTSKRFCQDCLSLPDTIKGCAAMVYDNKIVVSATIETPLIQYFTKNVSFEIENRRHRTLSKNFVFKGSLGTNQITLTITHQMPSDATSESLIETADAIRRTLRLHDSFGRAPLLEVQEMKYASMKDVSLRSTYESIRDAMIIGLADQMAMVQRLKLEGDGRSPERRQKSSVLTENTKIVARLVDSLVANASLHLIMEKFTHASRLVQELWHSSPPVPPETSITREDQSVTDKMLLECPTELRNLLRKMLDSFTEYNIRQPSTKKNWTEQGMPTLAQVHPKFDELARTLQNFGQELYDRDTNAEDHIEQAITQSGWVLSVMRFCHVIILTQLEAPVDLCVKVFENNFMVPGFFAFLFPGWWSFTTAYSWAVSYSTTSGMIALGRMGLAGVFGAAAATAASVASFGLFLVITDRPHHLQKSFDEMLHFSLQALRLRVSKFSIPETAITKELEVDDAKAGEPRVQKKWQERLSSGLRDFPAKPRARRYQPTLFWVKWLFDVGKVGKLRSLVVDRLCIGVEGPTEAGKSLLLTTLTKAPEKVFRPGFGLEFRTTEIQSYTLPNLTTVFCDCPGSDDQNSSIREMARLFRGLMNIIIFVIPCDNLRSQRTETVYKEIVEFIKQRREPRPFRILLNKIDTVEYDEDEPQVFEHRVIRLKKAVVEELNRLGNFPANFEIRTRQPFKGAIVASNESLEDIVQPYSTYAQMSKKGSRALSDCKEGVKRRFGDLAEHRNLYQLAEKGVLWDVESLRQWLRNLVPDSVPDSRGRVLQEGK